MRVAFEFCKVVGAREARLERCRVDGAGAGGVGCHDQVGVGEDPDDVAIAIVGRARAGTLHATTRECHRAGDVDDAFGVVEGGLVAKELDAVVRRHPHVAGQLTDGDFVRLVRRALRFPFVACDHNRAAVAIRDGQLDVEELRPSVLVCQRLRPGDLASKLAGLEALALAGSSFAHGLRIGAHDFVARRRRGALPHGEKDESAKADHEDGYRESGDFLPAHPSILAP